MIWDTAIILRELCSFLVKSCFKPNLRFVLTLTSYLVLWAWLCVLHLSVRWSSVIWRIGDLIALVWLHLIRSSIYVLKLLLWILTYELSLILTHVASWSELWHVELAIRCLLISTRRPILWTLCTVLENSKIVLTISHLLIST